MLLGLKEGAAPDAYKKVRLESFNSLTKAARKAAFWETGIRRAVGVALDLDGTIPGTRYDRSAKPLGLELRDGIPDDGGELANELSILRSAGILSTEGALERLLKDPAAIAKELGRLKEEREAATPPILMGGRAAGLDAAASAAGREPGEDGDAPIEAGVAA